jgi:stage V sporulation protein S
MSQSFVDMSLDQVVASEYVTISVKSFQLCLCNQTSSHICLLSLAPPSAARNDLRRRQSGGGRGRGNRRSNSGPLRGGNSAASSSSSAAPKPASPYARPQQAPQQQQQQQRASSSSSGNLGQLKVSGTSGSKQVAGAISHACRDGAGPTIMAAGPIAINTTVKAIAIARGNLVADNIELRCFPTLTDTRSMGAFSTCFIFAF